MNISMTDTERINHLKNRIQYLENIVGKLNTDVKKHDKDIESILKLAADMIIDIEKYK